MDDILKKLRQKKKRDKSSSPLGNIFGEVVKDEPEEKPEDEMEITHHDTKVREEIVTKGKGLRRVDFEKEPVAPVDILGGDGVRELSIGDLRVQHPEADRGDPTHLEKAAQPVRDADQNDNEIVLKTQDSAKVKFLKLVVALLESGYYDQAIETIHELRRATEH